MFINTIYILNNLTEMVILLTLYRLYEMTFPIDERRQRTVSITAIEEKGQKERPMVDMPIQ